MKYLKIEGDGTLDYPIGKIMSQVNKYINDILLTFEKNNIDLDKEGFSINLWCRGSSGAILAGIFASKFIRATVRIIHIKKQGEKSHQSYHHDICNGCDIVIDDFMDTGSTIFRIWHDSNIKKIDYLILENVPSNYFFTALIQQKGLIRKNYSEYTKYNELETDSALERPIPKVLVTRTHCDNINDLLKPFGSIKDLNESIKKDEPSLMDIIKSL